MKREWYVALYTFAFMFVFGVVDNIQWQADKFQPLWFGFTGWQLWNVFYLGLLFFMIIGLVWMVRTNLERVIVAFGMISQSAGVWSLSFVLLPREHVPPRIIGESVEYLANFTVPYAFYVPIMAALMLAYFLGCYLLIERGLLDKLAKLKKMKS